ncbi:uncharacterized protein M6B38_278230 [Iris pallida]|uniref:DNA-3-methyladenine glycosylase I n=1 Tax=Iris pallida TaxID=29817 RepID=A0AAX6I0N9_IRIPA|nr:uncharacterized protein M6B38_278230 [Iris pallida]
MSGAPRVRSMDPEARPVLAPAGNMARSVAGGARKPSTKPPEEVKKKRDPDKGPALRRQEWLLHSNLSLNASCSSDASVDSFCSRASTGRIGRNGVPGRRRERVPRVAATEKVVAAAAARVERLVPSLPPVESTDGKRRCGWVTANTDPCYVSFHDEEWGVPLHDDKKLFELLVLSSALAELTWPAILSKRHIFREVFMDFDPVLVSKLNEKKIIAPGSTASSLLSEPKLRAIIENAREVLKIIEEFGSFDRYCWSFVNQKPIVSRFRYSRQVPVKTPKADVISKDLIRRGFRNVGPTVIYSFMQAVGITNDHLITCYRFEECNGAATTGAVPVGCTDGGSVKAEEKGGIGGEDGLGMLHLEVVRAVDELSILS